MLKDNIRRIVLAKRNQLSVQDIRKKSKKIHERLFLLQEFVNAGIICVYNSFGSEVKTQEIIEKCAVENKKICLPAMLNDSGDLVPAEFFGFDKLKESFFGIMQPFPLKEMKVQEIDLVIVPGVAFDEEKNRIGFGKGFFDRFLAKLSKKVPVIALAFELQIVEKIPAEAMDIKMTKIVTETRII